MLQLGRTRRGTEESRFPSGKPSAQVCAFLCINMANATFELLEFRAVIKDHWTELFVRTGPASDGTLGIGGWYKKIIPPDQGALPALEAALKSSDYLFWDRGAPE